MFAARFLYHGFSFEAAYASQNTLSWQTGPPLYRPLQNAQIQHSEPRPASKLLFCSSVANINLAKARCPGWSRLKDSTPPGKSVLTEKLGDLPGFGKPSSAVEMWRRAVNLGPSPEQRVRLRLELEKNSPRSIARRKPRKTSRRFCELPITRPRWIFTGSFSPSPRSSARRSRPITNSASGNSVRAQNTPADAHHDTHAHLDYSEFTPDLAQWSSPGRWHRENHPSTDLDSSARAIQLAERFQVYAVAGWHPSDG